MGAFHSLIDRYSRLTAVNLGTYSRYLPGCYSFPAVMNSPRGGGGSEEQLALSGIFSEIPGLIAWELRGERSSLAQYPDL